MTEESTDQIVAQVKAYKKAKSLETRKNVRRRFVRIFFLFIAWWALELLIPINIAIGSQVFFPSLAVGGNVTFGIFWVTIMVFLGTWLLNLYFASYVDRKNWFPKSLFAGMFFAMVFIFLCFTALSFLIVVHRYEHLSTFQQEGHIYHIGRISDLDIYNSKYTFECDQFGLVCEVIEIDLRG